MSLKNHEVKCPKIWLLERLRSHDLDYDYKTDALKKGEVVVEEGLAMALLRLDARKLDVEEIRSYIRDALVVYRHERANENLKELAKKLTYNSSEIDLVAVWVKAVCGSESKLDAAIIKHFIWQVKRKLLGLSVENHIMPVVYGRSGIGKSVAVTKLIEPLKSAVLRTDMSIFSDQFSRRAFSRNFVVFFDELQGSDKADINAMKQIITANVVEWRAMRSEKVMSAPQSSTFIGCSNDPVRERIQDTTSSRRFWQINCSDVVDWNVINSIDYLALWRSIDENANSPIFECLNEVRNVQESEIRVKDIVEQWVEECCEIVDFDTSSLTTTELYDSFKDFCVWQSYKAIPQFQKFSRDIKRIVEGANLGLSKKTNKGTSWSIKIKPCVAVSVVEGSDDSDGQLSFDFIAA